MLAASGNASTSRSVTPNLLGIATLLAASCVLLGIVPTTARAGQASVVLGSLLYNASPGETNAVTISLEEPVCITAGGGAGCYVVTETGPGASITTGGGCSSVSLTTVVCPSGGISSVDVDVADGDDQVTIAAPTAADVSGGAGSDVLNGGPADDTLRGQLGRDTVHGNGGNDTIYGNDVLGFSDEPNSISADDGNDTVVAGNGGDTASGGNGSDTMLGGTGNDLLDGGAASDSISGGDGNDALLGQAGDDQLGRPDQQGTAPVARERGDDIFDGGPGDDTLQAGIGPTGGVSDRDTFDGGDGLDTVTYQQRSSALVISLDGRRDDGAAGEQDDVLATVENATAGTGPDTLTGSPAGNRLDGSGGADTISGAEGADLLIGSSGDDTERGGSGDDHVDGGTGEDFVDGGPGNDQLAGGGASDAVQSRDGSSDTVACGERVDFSIADRADKVALDCDRIDRVPADRPLLGSRAALQPQNGTLQLNLPEAQRFVPLEQHVNAPIGSSVDATDGRVRVATAVRPARAAASRKRARRQTAVFYDGAFRVRQSRSGRGLTDISLRGGDFGLCRGGRAFISASKRRVRRLWGSGKGKFRTEGRYSSAAVRGTKWLTEDRCDGTLTRVTRGRVVVFDQVRKRRKLLRAGQRYLARAP
jgi:Ca2+-binding RTX toxin-like protein